MNIFAVVAIGIIGALLAVTVKAQRPEYGMLVGISCGILAMLFMADGLREVLSDLKTIVQETGIDIGYFKIILKVTGISYITQFGAETARDAGENAIAAKIDAAGRIAVLMLAIPVVAGFIDVVADMVNKI